MLKLVLKNDIGKNLIMLLAVVILFIAFKITVSSSIDRQLADSVNSIVLEAKDMNYKEANSFVKSKTAELMQDAPNNHTGAVRDYLALRATEIDSRLSARLLDLNQAEENVNNAKFGSAISYGMPDDYFLDNKEQFSELPAPRLVGTGWEDFKRLQKADAVPVVIFLIVGIVYIREFEQRVYLSTAITKKGRRYASVRFFIFMFISCIFTLVNFGFDVFASGILSSAEIFNTPLQGLFPDCFVSCTVFVYLLYTLLFKLLAAINIFLLFYIAARISRAVYGYGMAGVSGILLFAIFSSVAPQVSCHIAAGFPDTELIFTNAASWAAGYGTIIAAFAVNFVVAGILFFCIIRYDMKLILDRKQTIFAV